MIPDQRYEDEYVANIFGKKSSSVEEKLVL